MLYFPMTLHIQNIRFEVASALYAQILLRHLASLNCNYSACLVLLAEDQADSHL